MKNCRLNMFSLLFLSETYRDNFKPGKNKHEIIYYSTCFIRGYFSRIALREAFELKYYLNVGEPHFII